MDLSSQASGALVNYHTIAKDLRIDDKTVKTYFEILVDTLVGFLLPAYDKSLRKQQLKSPKFYLFDCGVKRVLDPSLSVASPLSSQEFGLAFEHFVVCEMLRLKSYLRRKMSFSHFNTGSSEIDLVVETPGVPDTFVEIKATEKVTAQQPRVA